MLTVSKIHLMWILKALKSCEGTKNNVVYLSSALDRVFFRYICCTLLTLSLNGAVLRNLTIEGFIPKVGTNKLERIAKNHSCL